MHASLSAISFPMRPLLFPRFLLSSPIAASIHLALCFGVCVRASAAPAFPQTHWPMTRCVPATHCVIHSLSLCLHPLFALMLNLYFVSRRCRKSKIATRPVYTLPSQCIWELVNRLFSNGRNVYRAEVVNVCFVIIKICNVTNVTNNVFK